MHHNASHFGLLLGLLTVFPKKEGLYFILFALFFLCFSMYLEKIIDDNTQKKVIKAIFK
ncbi:MAG: hypothetical protein PVI90_06955 [Desulfobacteraceae bacterium]|jgi:hypothetical protein